MGWPHNMPARGGKPNETVRTTPVEVGNAPLHTPLGRELTQAELAAGRRQEAAKTWSPSTRMTPKKRG